VDFQTKLADQVQSQGQRSSTFWHI